MLSSRYYALVAGSLLALVGLRLSLKPSLQRAPHPPLPSIAQLRAARVNELGCVPILEYHDINQNIGPMSRAPEEFRRDLERLYAENYRPVLLSEYVHNRMDLPLGTSPVVITFDDARRSQFTYTDDGGIEPRCGIGILVAFHRAHPDFPLKATFFVLPERAFGSPKTAAQKMRQLLALGCEIENHTLNHQYFNHLSDRQIVMEIASGKGVTEAMVPGSVVDMLALPGGDLPRSRSRTVLVNGCYRHWKYHNQAVLLAAGGPAPSPVASSFRPYALPRVQAYGGPLGIGQCLDDLASHPGKRYVSDGDATTVTVPRPIAREASTKRVGALRLRVY